LSAEIGEEGGERIRDLGARRCLGREEVFVPRVRDDGDRASACLGDGAAVFEGADGVVLAVDDEEGDRVGVVGGGQP
jgi:hypothetical protein